MKKSFFILGLLFLSTPVLADGESSHGIMSYDQTNNNSAQKMADELRNAGFQVIEVTEDIIRFTLNVGGKAVEKTFDLITGTLTHPQQTERKLKEKLEEAWHKLRHKGEGQKQEEE